MNWFPVPLLWSTVCLASAALAQTWAPLEEVPGNFAGFVYDGAAQRLLGIVDYPQQTWSFDGQRWRLHWPDGLGASRPGLQPGTQLFGYDDARNRPVLVSSAVPWTSARTHVGHLGGWRAILPVSTPGVSAPGVAFDANLNLLLSFGGIDANGFETDAMAGWNGTQWTTLQPAVRPSPRSRPMMARDRARNRVVLYGGELTLAPLLADTWEFDGANWSQVLSSGPSARKSSLAYDAARQRVVMAGGVGGNGVPLQDVFEWSGGQWLASGSLPRAMPVHACSDATTVVVGTQEGELWRRSGTAWIALHTKPLPQVYGAAKALDPVTGGVVLRESQLGGRTWTWNGSWQVHAAAGPSARYGAAMAPYAGGMLLFGGGDTSMLPLVAIYDETWHWNGSSWSQLLLSNAPSHRTGHSMVAVGNTVLLFGGATVTGVVNDTWRFQGGSWTQLQPTRSPGPRRDASMAYDAARQRVVLHGGLVGGSIAPQPIGETWEWDGSDWLQQFTTTQPPVGTWPMVATSGGVAMQDDAGSLWLWNGSPWQMSSTGSVLPGPWFFSSLLRFDSGRQQLQLLDGGGRWFALYSQMPAVVSNPQNCGSAPELRMLGSPWLGSTPAVHCEGASNAPVFTLYGFQSPQLLWAPNCWQLASGDALHFGATNGLGQLDIPLAIPYVPSLRGLQLYVQSAVLDGGPVFGASLSGGLFLAIGG